MLPQNVTISHVNIARHKNFGWFPDTYTFKADGGWSWTLIEADMRSATVKWVVFPWKPDMNPEGDHSVGVEYSTMEAAIKAIMTGELM